MMKYKRYGRPFVVDNYPIFCEYIDNYSPWYAQYGRPGIIALRGYLYEKKLMGLIDEVQAYEDRNDLMCIFYLAGVLPNIWEKVLRPGILTYVNILSITTYTKFSSDTICLDIRVRE